MEILTGMQMRSADRHAIEELGIPGLDLMEAAGRGVVDGLWQDYPDLDSRPVLILCGKGNNGGDGLVVARLLKRAGLTPGVILFADRSELKGDAATNFEAAARSGLQVVSITGLMKKPLENGRVITHTSRPSSWVSRTSSSHTPSICRLNGRRSENADWLMVSLAIFGACGRSSRIFAVVDHPPPLLAATTTSPGNSIRRLSRFEVSTKSV